MQRKSAIIILAAICLFCCFAVTAHAHPGRTDSQGGHYDQGTGEYHYHHGYPAHDHYDMDGDGTLDCPYNFEDKTGDNSAVISDNNSGYETYTYPMPEDIGGNGGDRKPSSTQAFSEKGAVKMEIWKVCILVLAFLGIIAIMCFIIRNQIRDKKRQKVQYEEKFKRERAKFCEELGKINDEMIRKKERIICIIFAMHPRESILEVTIYQQVNSPTTSSGVKNIHFIWAAMLRITRNITDQPVVMLIVFSQSMHFR